jgi:peptide/nickel transport system substrate-binding protein
MVMRFEVPVLAAVLLCGASALPALAQQPSTLRIGIQDDPDILDPHRGNTFVGRIVFAALCDKLVDLNDRLEIVPMLATAWEWSSDGLTLTMRLRPNARFHDGTPIDAEAVKANLDRARTLPESRRRSELASIADISVVDPLTLAIRVSRPDASLVSQFTDRAGMIMSPRSFGPDTGVRPVCSGPYRFVERVQNDRIVLERFREHWRAEQYHFDRVIYRGIPDSTLRLTNLRAGDLDLMERIAPSDVRGARADRNLRVVSVSALGYQGITFNINHGPEAQASPARDRRVREALALSIDRNVLNQVVFEGLYEPSAQAFPSMSWAYDRSIPVPARNVERARQLLREAGVPNPRLEFQVGNSVAQQAVMQVIQAMAAEAGFDIRIRASEFATLIRNQGQGNFQVNQSGWSGRIDPDGQVHVFWHSTGGQNDGRYSNPEVDRLLEEARVVLDQNRRRELYLRAQRIVMEDVPIIYLYFQPWIYAMSSRIEGFTPLPDGMIRLENIRATR